VAVGHKDYLGYDIQWFKSLMKDKPVLIDLKGLYRKPEHEDGLTYWRL
jgi:UDP-N-acetyl-D-galactosamine dehydrogenase